MPSLHTHPHTPTHTHWAVFAGWHPPRLLHMPSRNQTRYHWLLNRSYLSSTKPSAPMQKEFRILILKGTLWFLEICTFLPLWKRMNWYHILQNNNNRNHLQFHLYSQWYNLFWHDLVLLIYWNSHRFTLFHNEHLFLSLYILKCILIF